MIQPAAEPAVTRMSSARVSALQAGHLQLTSSLQLSAPATGATLASASLQADSLTTTWSTGALQVFSLDSSRSSKQSQPSAEQLMRCSRKLSSSFQQMSEQGVFQHDSSQQHSTPAAAPAPKAFNSLPNGVVKLHLDTPDTKSSKKNKQAKGSGKKRKGGEREAAQPTSTAALPQGSALCASTSLAEGSVALASWENSAPDHQPSVDPTSHNGSLRLSLFDTCYGGVQHSRLLHGLQAPTATARFQVRPLSPGPSTFPTTFGVKLKSTLAQKQRPWSDPPPGGGGGGGGGGFLGTAWLSLGS